MIDLKKWLIDHHSLIVHSTSKFDDKIHSEYFKIQTDPSSHTFCLEKHYKQSTNKKCNHTFYLSSKEKDRVEIDSIHGYDLWNFIQRLMERIKEMEEKAVHREYLERSSKNIEEITKRILENDK